MNLAEVPALITARTFRVVIESPRGSIVKLKFDPKLNVMGLSRPLPLGMAYPFDWGFVPGTEGPDGDPLDAIVVWDTATFPGVVLPCRALGVIRVDQKKPDSRARVRNDRIVALPLQAPRYDDFRSVRDLSTRIREELEHFFVAVTSLEQKDIHILGWQGSDAALRLIKAHRHVQDRQAVQHASN
jgi:inorganic pyrophosphatase